MMKIALLILAGAAAFLLVVWIFKMIWNWLVPSVFKGPRIRFIHAFAILVLGRIFFGFGFHPGSFAHYRNHHQDNPAYQRYWKNHQPWFRDDKDSKSLKEVPEKE
jgi:hypothetical protein